MRRSSTILVLALLTAGCASTQKTAPTPRTKNGSAPAAPGQPEAAAQDAGDEERVPTDPRRRRMVIWGHVQRVMERKHAELPEAQAVSTGNVGDPVAEIKNGTPFALTLWFAGKCSHSTKVPPMGSVTAVFCPGSYNIAAVVDNKGYLPLVRENQRFEGGVVYQLQVVVRKAPR